MSASFAFVAIVIAVVDIPLDAMFICDLSPNGQGNGALFVEFCSALVVLMVAICGNFLCIAFFLRKEIECNPPFAVWMWQHRGTAIPIMLLSLFKFDCMSTMYSRARGLRAFSAPLAFAAQQRIVWLGSFGTVCEGIPQMIIAIRVHSERAAGGKVDSLVLAMLVTNFISLLYALLLRLVAGILLSEKQRDWSLVDPLLLGKNSEDKPREEGKRRQGNARWEATNCVIGGWPLTS
jgi:hypothetical protein